MTPVWSAVFLIGLIQTAAGGWGWAQPSQPHQSPITLAQAEIPTIPQQQQQQQKPQPQTRTKPKPETKPKPAEKPPAAKRVPKTAPYPQPTLPPQDQQRPPSPSPPADAPTQPLAAQPAPPPPPSERIEVDISTRTVEVTTVFSGTEVIIFGTVTNSRQESAESGFYDVVVVVEGRGAPSVVRLKSNVGGLWVNTQSVRFDNLPLYSAIATTRPIDEIAEPRVLVVNGIGFSRARMFPARQSSKVTATELDAYKSAVIRLKEKDGLYIQYDYGVAFIGRELFRATIKLPTNIPVGPLEARVFLFHDGNLLATKSANIMLQREGVDRLVYDFAFDHPFWYGVLTVTLAALAGLAVAAIFPRQTS